MEDYNNLVPTCASLEDFGKARRLLLAQVPLDVRRNVNDISIYYLHHYESNGMFDRMNNRTIGRILSEFAPSGGMESIVSGERDGVRFQLFESPENEEASESPRGSQDPRADG